MKKTEPIRIGEALRDCLEQNRMAGRLDESEACRQFAAVVGPGIAALCEKPYLFKGIMTVKVANAPLRQELNMRRGTVRDHINEILGKKTVNEVIFR